MALIWWQERFLSKALSLPLLIAEALSPLGHLSLDELNDIVARNDRDLARVAMLLPNSIV